jgi:hypothetical protein
MNDGYRVHAFCAVMRVTHTVVLEMLAAPRGPYGWRCTQETIGWCAGMHVYAGVMVQ